MSNWIIKQTAYNNISDLQISVVSVYNKLISPIIIGHDITSINFDGSQKPKEFFEAWKLIDEKLKHLDSPSMLEIGSYKGLWSIAFFEWCKLNNKKGEYYTITWMKHNQANEDLLRVQKYYSDKGFIYKLLDFDSQLQSTKDELLKYKNNFSFVFIDADHRYNGCYKDIQLYSSLSTNVLGFHDIRPKIKNESVGVYDAISNSNIKLDKEIILDENSMGIGLKFI